MTRRFWIVLTLLTAALVSLAALFGCGATQRPDGGEGLLPVGSPAPDLSAPDQNGAIQRLADQRGRAVVVYFYPKDGTPGCTEEACAFRDAWDRFSRANVMVFGVSTDDRESHESFSKEHQLPFPLLSDPDGVWLSAFGVSTKLGMASRVTFLIDPDGKIAKVYPDVDPALHADQVLKDAAALTGAAPADTSQPAAGAAPAAPASGSAAAPAPATPASGAPTTSTPAPAAPTTSAPAPAAPTTSAPAPAAPTAPAPAATPAPAAPPAPRK